MDLGRPRVGLVYDERMCLHATPGRERHPENPERIRAIWRKLESEGITNRCVVLKANEAEDEHIASVHTKDHIKLIRHISSKEFDSRRNKIASQFDSIYFNQGSSEAAYLAAGSVMEVSERVARGDLNSAIAIVRPPGHHAEPNEAMGFCLFNNIAITANFLLNEKPELGIKKILIVDWDVHHGNGTQNVFYKDPRVLFFSVHRFDFGSFYPAGGAGAHFMIGEDQGAGYNINVPWEHGQCGDADYIAVWDHVLLPVAEAYNPDIVLLSAGFDAAIGDPLGGCCITPFGYSTMLTKLMRFARGKIVMALEGGYNLNSIANSVLACAETLLEEKTIVGSSDGRPFKSTWRVIEEVRQELKMFWPILSPEIPPQLLISNSRSSPVEATLCPSFESPNSMRLRKRKSPLEEVEMGPMPPMLQGIPLRLLPDDWSVRKDSSINDEGVAKQLANFVRLHKDIRPSHERREKPFSDFREVILRELLRTLNYCNGVAEQVEGDYSDHERQFENLKKEIAASKRLAQGQAQQIFTVQQKLRDSQESELKLLSEVQKVRLDLDKLVQRADAAEEKMKARDQEIVRLHEHYSTGMLDLLAVFAAELKLRCPDAKPREFICLERYFEEEDDMVDGESSSSSDEDTAPS